MAPGPPDKTSNRFSILGDYLDQSNTTIFPQLPTTRKTTSILNDPKYVVITSNKDELRKLSPFVIHKALHAISTLIDSISQLRDGSLLLLVRNQFIAEKFLKTKTLSNICEITVKLHETLNSVKGVIYAPCLIDVEEDEIIKELSSQGVVSVYKYSFTKDDGKKQYSGYMVVTFNSYNLPKVVDVAWYKVKVRTYFPNPMRCKNCQILGHTKNKCSNPATCVQCNLPPHDPVDCTRLQCANCNEKHAASDKNCPRYVQQKEIIKIKTIDKCSFGAAKRKYEITIRQTLQQKDKAFAEVAKENNKTNEDPNKQIQKRSASPPTAKKPNEKLPRRESISSVSSSNDLDMDINSSSTNNKIISNTNSNKQQISTQKNILKTPTTIKKPTTSEKEKPNNKILTTKNPTLKSLKTSTDNTASPLSKLTQDLISSNEYFIPSKYSLDEILDSDDD